MGGGGRYVFTTKSFIAPPRTSAAVLRKELSKGLIRGAQATKTGALKIASGSKPRPLLPLPCCESQYDPGTEDYNILYSRSTAVFSRPDSSRVLFPRRQNHRSSRKYPCCICTPSARAKTAHFCYFDRVPVRAVTCCVRKQTSGLFSHGRRVWAGST